MGAKERGAVGRAKKKDGGERQDVDGRGRENERVMHDE